MRPTIADKYKEAFDSNPADKQSDPLWEKAGFEAVVSYSPAPHREKVLTFPDGSVFDYYDRWALSRTEWADRNKSIVGWD